MRYFISFFLAFAFCASGFAQSSNSFEGCWQSEDRSSTEQWLVDPSGWLFGYAVNRDADGKVTFSEQMVLIDDGLTVSGPNDEPVKFKAMGTTHTAAGTEYIFENAAHDYPQRIVYRPSAGRLDAEISLIDGSQKVEFLKESCAPEISSPDYNGAQADLSMPQGTAFTMMLAMYRGDADLVDQVFLPDATLRRVRKDGSVTGDARERWSEWVGTLEPGQAHERLFHVEVKQFDNLASVWAPFTIAVDGVLQGCGVNHMSMSQTDGEWRIVSVMDVQHDGDCESFEAQYQHLD